MYETMTFGTNRSSFPISPSFLTLCLVGVMVYVCVCLCVCVQPPEQRTSRDVRYMAGSIPKSSFLNTVDTDTLHRLCRVATYRTLDAGRALFFQGVPGDSFYILLTGEIAIHQLHDTTPVRGFNVF